MDDGSSASVGFIILALLLGGLALIPAFIARSKGREFGIWWVYGALLFIFALIHSLCLKPTKIKLEENAYRSGLRKCPECAEFVQSQAKKCRYCGASLPH